MGFLVVYNTSTVKQLIRNLLDERSRHSLGFLIVRRIVTQKYYYSANFQQQRFFAGFLAGSLQKNKNKNKNKNKKILFCKINPPPHLYRVFQNAAPPSRAQVAQPWVKSMIVQWSTSDLKWELLH